MPSSVAAPSAQPDDLWLVLPHLGPGGAQKVALLAAQHFASQGLRLRVVTVLPGHPLAHALPPQVEHLDLGPVVELAWRGDHGNRRWTARGRRFLRAQQRRLHRLVAKVGLLMAWPWIVASARPGRLNAAAQLLRWCVQGVSGPQAAVLQKQLDRCRPRRVLALLSRTNMLSCLALWDASTHLVVSERNDPTLQTLPAPWPRLQALLYQRADVVTANTQGVLGALAGLPGLQRLELLPNPLPARVPVERGEPVSQQLRFISVGRLVPQKGLDVLLDARARCTGAAASWPVELVGDGPERPALERQAEAAGLAAVVQFTGFRPDPQRCLAAAAVFVLPSRFEGMPNALLEAMAAGLAVIVSDASPGPLEVVEHRRTGLVVPVENPIALAAAMDELAADSVLRQRLGAAAQARIAALDWPAIEPIWRSVLALP